MKRENFLFKIIISLFLVLILPVKVILFLLVLAGVKVYSSK
jgi:hypothetical protein